MQGEPEEEVVRLRYRLDPGRAILGLVIFGAAGFSLYGEWVEGENFGGRNPLIGWICAVGFCLYLLFCLVRDAIVARFVVLDAEGITVPREFIGPPRRLQISDISSGNIQRHWGTRTLRLRTSKRRVRILSTWLPDLQNVEWLKHEIANRVEIATGRKLD